MHGRAKRPGRTRQAGFSMVELLMAAFILAIGLLGLAALQLMALRATRGSQNQGLAIQLAEKIMDQVELEGRETYLNTEITQYSSPTALGGITYITNNSVDQYYNLDPATGNLVQTAASPHALFHVNMKQVYSAGVNLSDVTVKVDYQETANGGGQVLRSATIARRILHG